MELLITIKTFADAENRMTAETALRKECSCVRRAE